MPFNIAQFNAQINKSDVAKSANFEVMITGPASISDSGLERDMMFRTDSAGLAGRNIQTADYTLYGIMEKIGYDMILTPLEISVILSADLREKEYFQKWQDLIIGPYRQNQFNTGMFKLGWYDDYIGTVIVKHYDDTANLTYSQKFIEAYPINIGDVSRTWENGAEILKLPVTFNYRFYLDGENN